MVECHLAKVDVEGSNPFSRSAMVEGGAPVPLLPSSSPQTVGRDGRTASALNAAVNFLRFRLVMVHASRIIALEGVSTKAGEVHHNACITC